MEISFFNQFGKDLTSYSKIVNCEFERIEYLLKEIFDFDAFFGEVFISSLNCLIKRQISSSIIYVTFDQEATNQRARLMF